jgi:4-hydroxybenzoate polyprenyltransferase
VAVNLLLVVAAMALNTAVDVRTDERRREKRYLASATRRFGRDRVVRWAATEMALAMLLACLVTAWSARPVVLVTAAAIIVIQVLYHVEPVRLKRRGLTGVVVFCVSLTARGALWPSPSWYSGVDGHPADRSVNGACGANH